MIRKFANDGSVIEFDSPRVVFGKSRKPIEVPILLDTPERKYEGQWLPGTNQPTLPPLESGPYAGITRYLPIPEEQIER